MEVIAEAARNCLKAISVIVYSKITPTAEGCFKKAAEATAVPPSPSCLYAVSVLSPLPSLELRACLGWANLLGV